MIWKTAVDKKKKLIDLHSNFKLHVVIYLIRRQQRRKVQAAMVQQENSLQQLSNDE